LLSILHLAAVLAHGSASPTASSMSLLEEWWKEMPPVTRSYVSLSVITTAAVALEVITPLKLYLNWNLVFQQGHVWRPITNFFYFGNLNLDFLFHMFFLYRYCKMLEINSFRGRTADFLFMLVFGSALLLAISPLTSILFLGPSLTFMMVYVWARRNSLQVMNFLGVLSFRAPYLPWVLLLFSFVLGSSPAMDMLGVLAGHVYYFLADVYPQMSGVHLLATPRVLAFLCGDVDTLAVDNHAAYETQNEPAAAAAGAAPGAANDRAGAGYLAQLLHDGGAAGNAQG
jgi:Derlin-2/3